MKTYGEVAVKLHEFLTSGLCGGEWSAPYPGRFTPERRPLPPVLIGCEAGWAPEPSGRNSKENEIPASAGNRSPVVELVASSLY